MGAADLGDKLSRLNKAVGRIVWGPWMPALMLGVGIFLTLRLSGIQFIHARWIFKNTVGALKGGEKKSGNGKTVTPFQAMTAALAGTVGVGNIAGVAGAIAAGGPGAVFWMWISALFGMAIKFSEITLAVRFRKVDRDGRCVGGPMVYIEEGLGSRWLAGIFAFFGGMASFGIGSMTQASEISSAVTAFLNFPAGSGEERLTAIGVGVILAAASALVIFGGIGRIGAVTEWMVPFMALFYVLGSGAMLLRHASAVPGAFRLIFREAFCLRAAGGGLLGSTAAGAIRHGVARGLFSNEAGLGSAPIAHAASEEKDPVRQGFWGIFEVFTATLLLCTCTALIILVSGQYGGADSTLTGGALTAAAFEALARGVGGRFVRITVILFALSTIFGWSYYGSCCVRWLFGGSLRAERIYLGIFVLFTAIGAVGDLKLVWEISDTMNGLMAIPNLIAVAALSGEVKRLTQKHFSASDLRKTKKKVKKRL